MDVDEPAAVSEVKVSDVPVCVADDSAALDSAVDESSFELPCEEEPNVVLEFPVVDDEPPDELLALECVVTLVV